MEALAEGPLASRDHALPMNHTTPPRWVSPAYRLVLVRRGRQQNPIRSLRRAWTSAELPLGPHCCQTECAALTSRPPSSEEYACRAASSSLLDVTLAVSRPRPRASHAPVSSRSRSRSSRVSSKSLRTTNSIENLDREFQRRAETKVSRSTEEAALPLIYGAIAFSQIRMRRTEGHLHLRPDAWPGGDRQRPRDSGRIDLEALDIR